MVVIMVFRRWGVDQELKETKGVEEIGKIEGIGEGEEIESNGIFSDKRLIWGAVVFSIIAIVLSVFGLISVRKLEDVENKVSKLEDTVAYNKHKFAVLTSLERIYNLTMVDRDYESAKRELLYLKAEYSAIRDSFSQDEKKRLDDAIRQLEEEINRGPSPIPKIIANLRSIVSTGEPKLK